VPDARFPSILPAAGGQNLTSLQPAAIVGGTFGAINAQNLTNIPGQFSWQSTIITSSSTVIAGRGYWINTTSNEVTITLPASASVGDEIIFSDYARTWGTNKIIIDSNGLNYQGDADTLIVEYTTSGESVNIVYSGATKGWIPLYDGAVVDAPVPRMSATGGTISYSGIYTVHTFTSSGTFTPDKNGSVDYLVVAGGGAGGGRSGNATGNGGGGAGGFKTATSFAVAPTGLTVTIGAGGAGGGSTGGNGNNSVFSTITSTGGGGGGTRYAVGNNGGSGGGSGSEQSSKSSGTGTEGKAGGAGGAASNYPGGGGGGHAEVGVDATGNTAGNGGSGTVNSYSGSSIYYAGGGGGGTHEGGTIGNGGSGGGANGGAASGNNNGLAGTANTGGGGGGGSSIGGGSTNGGNGGDGIVIIRYLT
jgi:hypothetical protein